MKKGICFYFGFNEKPILRMKEVKNAGFDVVMTNADPKFNYQNGNIRKQIKVLKKANLGVSSLHMRYNRKELPHLFINDKIGDKIEKNLIKDVKIAHKYGFKCVVVHLGGIPSQIGIDRILHVLKVCEKKNIPLAFENLSDDVAFEYVMQNVKHPLVRFCFDVGHRNVFHPEKDYLKLYGDRLICVHLHDNDGTCDQHTLNKFGNIDWKKTAKDLARCPEVNLDYEILLINKPNMGIKQVLETVYSQAVELEILIKKEKARLEKSSQNKEKEEKE